jgi:hypothetical protein
MMSTSRLATTAGSDVSSASSSAQFAFAAARPIRPAEGLPDVGDLNDGRFRINNFTMFFL